MNLLLETVVYQVLLITKLLRISSSGDSANLTNKAANILAGNLFINSYPFSQSIIILKRSNLILNI